MNNIQSKANSINRYEKAAAAIYRKYGYNEFSFKQFEEVWGGPIRNFNYKDYGVGNFEKIYSWKQIYDFAQMEVVSFLKEKDKKIRLGDIIEGCTRCVSGINTPYRDEKGNPVHYEYPMLTEHIHSMKYTDPIGATFSHYYYTYSLNPDFFEKLRQIKLQLQAAVQGQVLKKLEKMKKECAKIRQLAIDFDFEDCLEDIF